MGITIRGAAAVLPPPTDPEGDIAEGASLACKRPYQADHKMSVETGSAAVSAALEQARLTVDDVDMIISKGVSPSHLAGDPAIMGPRVGHAIQKELRLPNAFVFDLMDADFTFAMDIAESFFLLHSMKTALLVHTECSAPGVMPCKDTGFTVADGASCMVIEFDILRPTLGSTFRDVPGHSVLEMLPLEGDALTAGLKRTRMQWDLKDSFFGDLSKQGSECLSAEMDKHPDASPTRYVTEDWFGGVEIAMPTDKRVRPAEELGYLGPHSIPHVAATLLAEDHGEDPAFDYLTTLCFNPFKMRFGSRLTRLRRRL